ncbi:MAG TPA: hypothetical protein VFI30_02825 [Nocardioidaceae bacterium]|nr:hypothetical protein [Nocardioidaceae bacterium]
MAGFVAFAVVARHLGGWLSDRYDPTRVLAVVFGIVAVCALVQSATPVLIPIATVAFLVMAGALGTGAGAVFAPRRPARPG